MSKDLQALPTNRHQMTIQSIYLTQQIFDDMNIGISELPLEKPLDMRSLGKTVVLAGPNGAGKTRLLNLIPKLVSKCLDADTAEQINHQIRQSERNIEDWARTIQNLSSQEYASDSPEFLRIKDNVKRVKISIASAQTAIERFHKDLRSSSVITIEGNKPPRVVSFVPKQPKLVDPVHTTEAEANRRADSLTQGTADAETNAPAYARKILRLAMEQGYDRHENGLHQKTPAEHSRDELIAILSALLGPNVKIKIENSRLKIGEIEDYSKALSPGQQVLFQFGCLLHSQNTSLAECVVLMDEPENHLHPAVLEQIVGSLRKSLSGGQLWIATHSVPLIAQLMSDDSDCLWFVNDGVIKRSGRSPENVLNSLMGGPLGATHLHNLTLLPAQYAAIRFLTECLDAPGAVGPDVKDPQTNQIAKIIRQKTQGKPIRILDFGAGKGRLLSTLITESEATQNWLDYYAYDIYNDYRAECEREISSAYGSNSPQRWYSDLHSLEAQVGSGSIDLVVMCNVLHEIDPDKWLLNFAKGSVLQELVANDGHLLVVEDYGIPVGERAHRYGFLLLDEQELCKLFQIDHADRENGLFLTHSSEQEQYRDRLKASLISKVCVERISTETRQQAIEKLNGRMLDDVASFLQSDKANNSIEGRRYARSAQLVANTSCWLREHGSRTI